MSMIMYYSIIIIILSHAHKYTLSLRLQRLAVILLVLHYSVEFLFHASRLLHYHGKDGGREREGEEKTSYCLFCGFRFKLWRVLFVLVRVGTVIISVLTLW